MSCAPPSAVCWPPPTCCRPVRRRICSGPGCATCAPWSRTSWRSPGSTPGLSSRSAPVSRSAAVVSEAVTRTGLDAEVTVADAPGEEAAQTVETDPRRLERIVSNLVVNAHRHGATPVQVTVEGRTVVVRDHGPGFPPDLLRDGPRRFHTGATERGSGHGLGLTIALGQARLLGAELRLDNAPDGGAVATLRLPA